MHSSLKMDFIFCQGVKYSYLLTRRPSICSLNLLSFLHKYPEVVACRQIQYLDKYPDRLRYLNNYNISSNQNGKRFKSCNLRYKFNAIDYSTLSKSDSSSKFESSNEDSTEKNITAFQKMKQLAKNYWSVLVPVHIVTSVCWASMFYIAIKHGVDIIGILKSLHLSEKYLDLLRKSNAGDWAFTYALYKICTPLRYTVTIGLTTACVRYLKNIGYLKTVKKTQQEPLKFTEKYRSTSNKSNVSNENKELQSPKT